MEHRHQHAHHGLADLMERLEPPDRDAWQKPEEVIACLALKPGSVVAEIGAGTGYFSLRLGRSVGGGGTVFAVDVQPEPLTLLRDRILQHGLRNIVPVLGLEEDPLLPPESCDLVLMVNAFHHLQDPVAWLKRLRRSLRSGGRIANIDFHKRPTPIGPPEEMRIDRLDYLRFAQEAALTVSSEHDFLPHQYFVELVAKS